MPTYENTITNRPKSPATGSLVHAFNARYAALLLCAIVMTTVSAQQPTAPAAPAAVAPAATVPQPEQASPMAPEDRWKKAQSQLAAPPRQLSADDAAKVALVRTRASERLQLIAAGKFAEAYEFLSPVSRAATKRDDYVAELLGLGLRQGAVQDVDCDTAGCTVHSLVTIRVVVPRIPISSAVTTQIDRWTIIDGQAWLLRR